MFNTLHFSVILDGNLPIMHKNIHRKGKERNYLGGLNVGVRTIFKRKAKYEGVNVSLTTFFRRSFNETSVP